VDLPYEDPALDNFLRAHYHKPPDTRPLRGFDYALRRCSTCALVYQEQVPGPGFLPVLYDQWISPDNLQRARDSRTLEDSALLAAEVHFLIRALGLTPGQIHTLDYGCGWGDWANMARAYGCQAAGVELSVERERYARSIALEVFSYEDIPDDTFHFVNTEQVFEHLTEPAQVLRTLVRSLRPGGLLRISVPDATQALRRLASRPFAALSRAEVMPIHPLEHVNSFTPSTLDRFGTGAGLELYRPSLRLLYEATAGWGLKPLVRPLYRHVWPRTTIAYFRKPGRPPTWH
jgi:SAM-dependent methyltransferase